MNKVTIPYSIHLCICLLIGQLVYAQNQNSLSALRPGDSVPDIPLQMINYEKESATLRGFKEKLIILDFWATWCGSCIAGFSKMEKLQKDFRKEIKIILVNANDRPGDVQSFFKEKRNKDGQLYKLPTAVGGGRAKELFPYRLIPHYVWILDGRLKAFTSSAEVSEMNIRNVLNDPAYTLKSKEDDLTYKKDKPLLFNNYDSIANKVLYRSMLTGYLGISSHASQSLDENKLVTRVTFANYPIINLYQAAYGKRTDFSRIKLNIDNPSSVFIKEFDIEKYDKAYCYEILVPGFSKEKVFKLMREDLYRYFGYVAKFDTLPTLCFVIKANTLIPELQRKQNPENGLAAFNVRNKKLASIVHHLNSTQNIPVIDESNYSLPVDLDFDIRDLNSIKKSLAKYNLCLIEEMREIEHFVITK